MYRVFIVFDLIFFIATTMSTMNGENNKCKDEPGSNSFLWAMRRNPPAYFFGTIHVPYTRVWNHISQTAKEAFFSSQDVYFELDLTDSETLSALMQCQMLPGGTGLKEILPADIYLRLKLHLDYVKDAMPDWVTSEQKGKGLHPDTLYEAIVGNWERKKPVWVMLMVNSLTEADIKTRGTPVLDLHLARKAVSMGKKIGAVERVEEQCKPLNGLNISQVLFALNHTLMVQEKLRRGIVKAPYTTDDLIDQYNCGKLESVMFDKDSVQVPKMDNKSRDKSEYSRSEVDNAMALDIDLYFKNELIYHRNKRMAARIKNLLEVNPQKSFFFAIGAGHFLGNGSVIDFLKRYGYEIESVKKNISYRSVIQVHGSKNKKRNSGKHKNRKRDRLLRNGERRRRRKKRKRKGMKEWSSDFLTTNYKRTTFNFFPSLNGQLQVDEDYTLVDQENVRVISYRPTGFPSNLYKKRLKKLYSRHKSGKKRNKNHKTHKNKSNSSSHKDNSNLYNDLSQLNNQIWKQPTSNDSASNQIKDFPLYLMMTLLSVFAFLFLID